MHAFILVASACASGTVVFLPDGFVSVVRLFRKPIKVQRRPFFVAAWLRQWVENGYLASVREAMTLRGRGILRRAPK